MAMRKYFVVGAMFEGGLGKVASSQNRSLAPTVHLEKLKKRWLHSARLTNPTLLEAR
jgi:hypothetical protein